MVEATSSDDGPGPALEELERFLLGGPRSLTRHEVAARAGVPIERAEVLWRALGFTRTGDDDVFFGEADVQAMQLAARLSELGAIDESQEASIVRTAGRAYARLADWQTRLMAQLVPEDVSPEDMRALAEELIPMMESLQLYVWRRHVLATSSRLMLQASPEDGTELSVGFADIVGYTSQSRRLSRVELEQLVEHFETVTNEVVTRHGGRIIKTLGDEVLFVADTPTDAARIALELVEVHGIDPLFPQVRVGAAHGTVLSRLGDVFGPVVNLASRLTSIGRPGRAMIDRGMADALEQQAEFSVRRSRRTSVKGYERLEPWSLRRPRARESSRS